MGNTFSFVNGDQAIAGDDGWQISVRIDDWDERFLGEAYLQLSELDTLVGTRDHFAVRDGARAADDLGTIECRIERGSGGDALPFICTDIQSRIAAGETRHSFTVRLPTGGTIAHPQWSEPIRVPIRGEVAGESRTEGNGYEIDFKFKNKQAIPAGTSHREPAMPADSVIAPLRSRTWIRLDFHHCPSCWVLERKLGLLHASANPRTDKIVGGNIWVGGKAFFDWFNQDFRPHHRTAYARGSIPYRQPFVHWYQHCGEIYAAELSLAQFVATVAVTYNECQGFIPTSEGGDMSYFFEYRQTIGRDGQPKRKNSYNRCGFARSHVDGEQRRPGHNANSKAGDQLYHWWHDTAGKGAEMRDDGVTEEMIERELWNGVWWKYRVNPPHWPDNPPTIDCPDYHDHTPNPNLHKGPFHPLAKWVRQCDFNKLRGRGMLQSTGRGNYIDHVRPALRAAGHRDFDELTDDELDDAIKTDVRVSAHNYRFTLQGIDTHHDGAMRGLGNGDDDDLFYKIGLGYAGTQEGGRKVRERSRQLFDAMTQATWECRPIESTGLAQIRAGGSDTEAIRAMQLILADLGYPGDASGTFDAATVERLREFEAFFSVQNSDAQQLSVESALQMLKWHEVHAVHGFRTSPQAARTRPQVEPVQAPESVEDVPDPVPEPAAPEGHDSAAPEDTAPPAPAPSPPPPAEPDPVATRATHDEHDTVPVEGWLFSHAMADCEDLVRVVREPAFRRPDAQPLAPGDARMTSTAIEALQHALRALHYDLGTGGAAHDGVDGRWSTSGRTVRAIQQHQRARGPLFYQAGSPQVYAPVRTDGRLDWPSLFIIDRDARIAEDAANAEALASSLRPRPAPSTPSAPAPESGDFSDRPARALTRRQALEQLAALNNADGLGVEFLDPDHGGARGYGSYPDCRVRLPSPCYGVIVRVPNWGRAQIDPRLALGVARMCRWLHDRGVIQILHDHGGGFLGNDERRNSPHGRGCALDLSCFDFDADRANADYHGHTRLEVRDTALWPRYDACRYRCDGDPGLLSSNWQYASDPNPTQWRGGNVHDMVWVHPTGARTSVKRFHTSDPQAAFETLQVVPGQSPILVRADGVPAELQLFHDASLLPMAVRPSSADAALPFGTFIADLYEFVQREFKINQEIDERDVRSDPVPLEAFDCLVNPCHPRLGHGQTSNGGPTTHADNAGPHSRFGHQDHLHLQVPDIRPYLPRP